jgi:small subunit ribosomal protein S6
MRNYEIAYIADPELDEQALKALEDRVKGVIESSSGQATKVDRWGRRRLAYPIRKKNDGYYVFIEAELPPQAGSAIERDLRFNEQILRFMITAVEPGKTPEPKAS